MSHSIGTVSGIVSAAPAEMWYAVHTRSRFEKKVASEIAAKNIEQYLPLYRELHAWKDRRKEVDLPLFPGYVFVRMLDTMENRLAVLRTAGAVRVLGTGDSLDPIPDHEVEGIQRLLRSSLPFCVHPFLREGSRVRVRRGPLEGVEGFLTRVKTQNRLVLTVDMLARSVATEVGLSDVEVVGGPLRRSA